MSKRLRVMMGFMALLLAFSMILAACGDNAAENADAGTSSEKGNTETNQEAGTSGTSEDNQKEGSGNEAKKELPFVELTYYYPGTVQKDNALVEEAMNKILKEKINAHIKLKQIDWGSYDQKMNLMNATGDAYDLAFTSSWTNNFTQNVEKNAFYPITDLLDPYAPGLKASMPAKIWDAARVDGEIYAVPNQQIWATARGFYVRKDLAEKYGLDPAQIKKPEDMEPFFDQILQKEQGVIPLAFFPGDSYLQLWEGIYTGLSGGIDVDKELQLSYRVDNPETKAAVELARKWYETGYVHKDIASIKEINTDFKAGKYAATLQVVKPGGEADMANRIGHEVIMIPMTTPYITTGTIQATMNAVSRTSKNPERAVMLLELLNTDKELYRLLCHGIEGTHYKKVTDELISFPDGVDASTSSYNPSTDWMFGNQFNAYYVNESQVGAWEETKKLNDSADISPTMGFKFDIETVKTEIAQISAIDEEMRSSIYLGVLEPSELDKFRERLMDAGMADVMTEAQKQLDAWKKSNP